MESIVLARHGTVDSSEIFSRPIKHEIRESFIEGEQWNPFHEGGIPSFERSALKIFENPNCFFRNTQELGGGKGPEFLKSPLYML